MQLCKCLNCSLKAQNKQLNQYCCNFFFCYQNFFFKWFRFRSSHKSSWVDLQKTRIGSRVNSFLLQVKKIRFRLGIFQVRSNQKILTRFAMSTWESANVIPDFDYIIFFFINMDTWKIIIGTLLEPFLKAQNYPSDQNLLSPSVRELSQNP